MTNLENFIRMHRSEFDIYQPGTEVWAGISTGLTAPALLPKAGKFFGGGTKNILLLSAVTSTILAVGVWKFKGDKPPQTQVVPLTGSIREKETPTETQTKAPVERQKTTLHYPASKDPIEPIAMVQIPAPVPVPTVFPVVHGRQSAYLPAEPGDSSYSGIKKLVLKCPGYSFKIRRSDSQLTWVRIVKRAELKNKDNQDPLLKIEQKETELVFGYEETDKKRGQGSNFQIKGPGEIEIFIPDGEIDHINAHSSDMDLSGFTVRELSIYSNTGKVHAVDLKGKLNITSSSGDQVLSDISGDLQLTAVTGDIGVKNQVGQVKIMTSSGEIMVENAQGNVTTHSVSGDVQASAIKGEASFTSSSGDQRLSKINGELQITTISGDVSIEDQSGNVRVMSSSGEVSVSSCTGNLSCQTISGSIRLNGLEGRLDLRSSAGDISGESVKLVGNCSIQTVSGNVSIGLKNAPEELRFDLSSVSGNLKIKKGKVVEGEKSLKSGEGKILVSGNSSSGDQVYW